MVLGLFDADRVPGRPPRCTVRNTLPYPHPAARAGCRQSNIGRCTGFTGSSYTRTECGPSSLCPLGLAVWSSRGDCFLVVIPNDRRLVRCCCRARLSGSPGQHLLCDPPRWNAAVSGSYSMGLLPCLDHTDDPGKAGRRALRGGFGPFFYTLDIPMAGSPRVCALPDLIKSAKAQYHRLSDCLRRSGRPLYRKAVLPVRHCFHFIVDRKSTRLNSSHANISYAVFC